MVLSVFYFREFKSRSFIGLDVQLVIFSGDFKTLNFNMNRYSKNELNRESF